MNCNLAECWGLCFYESFWIQGGSIWFLHHPTPWECHGRPCPLCSHWNWHPHSCVLSLLVISVNPTISYHPHESHHCPLSRAPKEIDPSSVTQWNMPFPVQPQMSLPVLSPRFLFCKPSAQIDQSPRHIFHIAPPCLFSCPCLSLMCTPHLSSCLITSYASWEAYSRLPLLTCSSYSPGTCCPRHCRDYFTHIILFNPHNDLWGNYYYDSHLKVRKVRQRGWVICPCPFIFKVIEQWLRCGQAGSWLPTLNHCTPLSNNSSLSNQPGSENQSLCCRTLLCLFSQYLASTTVVLMKKHMIAF